MMVMPFKAGESQPSGAWPLHVLHAYTRLKMSSSKVSVMVRNMSDCPIFLKKGIQVGWVVLALLVSPAELSPEIEAALGMETMLVPMPVTTQQENLLEKLNLDGLRNWTPQNVEAAKEFVFAFHNIFTVDGNELSCTSAIEHEICINDSEPFKEQFRHIPPLLFEEVCASLRDMLDAGVICPSQSPWCNAVVLVWIKDRSLCFCVDFCRLNTHTLKDLYPLP